MSELRELRLREFARTPNVELSTTEVAFLRSAQAGLSVLATGRTGVYDIEASERVGTLVSDTLHIVIEPKTPIPSLLHVLGYGGLLSLTDVARFGEAPDLAKLLARLYAETLARALANGGPVAGYREVRDELRLPRGRIDWFALETKRFGLFPPVPCAFPELDLDTELNRRLVAAGRVLLRIMDEDPSALERSLQRFVGVENVAYGRMFPAVVLDRRTERFRAALSLAEAVLRHVALNLSTGNVLATGFLLDMSAAFEDFAMGAVGQRLGNQWTFVRSPGGLTLDIENTVTITPDGQLLDRGKTICVLDAKYKVVTDAARSADLYQMLAYCTALGASVGVLVYAEATERRYVLRQSGVTVQVFGVLLDRSPWRLVVRHDCPRSRVC